MYIGNVILLILNVPLIGAFVKLMAVPFALMSPSIVIICTIGAYSMNYNPVEILIMFIFGLIGYFLKKFDYELAPLMLAFVLGGFFEKAIRQSLILSHGSPMIFATRPISAVLFGVALALVLYHILSPLMKRSRNLS